MATYYILLCLTLEDFTCQGEASRNRSGVGLIVETSPHGNSLVLSFGKCLHWQNLSSDFPKADVKRGSNYSPCKGLTGGIADIRDSLLHPEN